MTFGNEDEGSHTLRLSFVDADGKSIMPGIDMPVEVSLPGDSLFSTRNFIVNIQQLKLERFGAYSIDLAVDGRHETSLPLVFKQVAAATPGT